MNPPLLHKTAQKLIEQADIKTISHRPALTGSASFLDVLFLAPGIHCRQASLREKTPQTTGDVFRVENQAAVVFLRRVGLLGHYFCFSPPATRQHNILFTTGVISSMLYLGGIVLTITTTVLLYTIRDWWGLGMLGMLMFARLLNVVVVIKRWGGKAQQSRMYMETAGLTEPGSLGMYARTGTQSSDHRTTLEFVSAKCNHQWWAYDGCVVGGCVTPRVYQNFRRGLIKRS